MSGGWFATFAAGFGPLALRLARRDFPDGVARLEGDNALRISGARHGPGVERDGDPMQAVPRSLLAYCVSLFRVIAEAPGGLERAARSIAADSGTARAVPGDAGRSQRDGRSRGAATFVLRGFGPDDPAPIPREARLALEELISRSVGGRPDSERPDREYRLQERADGTTLFLERVAAGSETVPGRGADPARAGEPPRRGELPRTTCRLLAEMTEPRPDDVFLDPFCGYGGIALERALAGSYRFIFAADTDPEKAAAVKGALAGKAFERRRKTIFPKVRDALDPTAFEPGFVTAIATDPPWGLYEGGPEAGAASELLRRFLEEAARELPPGGRLVLLTARSAEVEPGREFAQRERLDVLISGKKAKVLRLDRV